jgi:hypothetical protein
MNLNKPLFFKKGMKLFLLFFIMINDSNLQTKIEPTLKEKSAKNKKDLLKKCSKFRNGKFTANIEPYGLITIIRHENSQIEFRTKEYFTKEKIIWLDACKFKKIYLEIHDPIFSQKDIDELKNSKFVEQIIEIHDDRHFVSTEFRNGIQSVPLGYEKVD